MFAVSDDGIRLRLAVDGPEDADALLLLNSLGCDLTMWDAQIEVWAKRFRVIRFDARGHGGSDAPAGNYTLQRLGQDALAVLDAAGVRRAHVCGISLGGITAQWLAAEAPDRVCGLVLANTAARIGTVEIWQARLDIVLSQGMASIADAVLGRFFSDAFRAASPDTVERFRHVLLHNAARGYAGCCAALRDADLRGRVGSIASPTLVIGGRSDVSTPLPDAELLASLIKAAELLVLDTAHLSNVEEPSVFAEAVRRHLEAAG